MLPTPQSSPWVTNIVADVEILNCWNCNFQVSILLLFPSSPHLHHAVPVPKIKLSCSRVEPFPGRRLLGGGRATICFDLSLLPPNWKSELRITDSPEPEEKFSTVFFLLLLFHFQCFPPSCDCCCCCFRSELFPVCSFERFFFLRAERSLSFRRAVFPSLSFWVHPLECW